MADYYFYLDQLSPTDALRVLAEAVRPSGERHLMEVRLIVQQGQLGVSVTLIVPDAHATGKGSAKEKQERHETFAALMASYKNVWPNKEHARKRHDGLASTLPEGVTRLLLQSTRSPKDELALAAPGEYLLVGRNLDQQRAGEIFEELRFHATQTRVATAETGANQLYLFHVLDDPQRRSSFLSVVAGQVFAGCSLLTCFTDDGWSVFLPQEIIPGRYGLAYFCRLLRAAPALFGLHSASTEPGLLAAIEAWPPGTASFELLPLALLKFYAQPEFMPPAMEYADFKVCELKDSLTARVKLRQAIEAAEPGVGYRLELRPTRQREPGVAERTRLRQQQVELTYKLAYLDSLAQPRPTLLRFSQKQLPALADVIRSFPKPVMRDGLLLYGFQGTYGDPAGLHYIFIEPYQEVVMTELDPLAYWGDLDDRPMRFWLDPYWAGYYYGRGNKCLVFVPEGTALFPPLHDWNMSKMDAYMRAVMSRWFHGHYGVAAIPERPIYIFDGEARPDAAIQISVLDQARLQPLRTQLGWLNDNLVLIDAIGVENLIQEMANQLTRQDFARQITTRAEAAERNFTTVAQATSGKIAARLNELTEVITREIDRVVSETAETVAEIRQLRDRLTKLESVCRELGGLAVDVDRSTDQTKTICGEVNTIIRSLHLQVDQALAKVETERRRLENQVSGEIDSLQNMRRKLKHRLSELKSEGA